MADRWFPRLRTRAEMGRQEASIKPKLLWFPRLAKRHEVETCPDCGQVSVRKTKDSGV